MEEEKAKPTQFESITQFEPFWWGEHTNKNCKRLHVIGSTFALLCWMYFIYSRELIFVIYGLLFNYGFAWSGHYFCEENRPATFNYPYWSLYLDLLMCLKTWTLQRKF